MRQILGRLSFICLIGIVAACSPGPHDEVQDKPTVDVHQNYVPRDVDPLIMEKWTADTHAAIEAAKATRGKGTPPLWRYKKGDVTVFIFGSVHYMSAKDQWRTTRLNRAFKKADRVVFEIDFSDESIVIKQNAAQLAEATIKSDKKLSDFLTETQKQIVIEFFDDKEMSYWGLQKINPWLVADFVAAAAGEDMDMSMTFGVESVLSDEAEENGAEIHGLETIDERMRAFKVPMANEVEALIRIITVYDQLQPGTEVLIDEWLDGDMAGLTEIVTDPGMTGSGGGYNGLITIRNKNWVPDIIAFLEEPGVTFIIVGSGHLVGRDSLFLLLEEEGYPFKQIQ